MSKSLPILYTFRRCPYAIRARLALASSKLEYEAREVSLKRKPASMLQFSEKATVPILVLDGGQVIDESLDIMFWALTKSDPEKLLPLESSLAMKSLRPIISDNDCSFKYFLDRYKYSDRFPQQSKEYYREQGEVYLQKIENFLMQSDFLAGNKLSFLDLAIVPFIRQFAYVDEDWFFQSRYENAILWLRTLLSSDLFLSVMNKNSIWEE